MYEERKKIKNRVLNINEESILFYFCKSYPLLIETKQSCKTL